MQQDEEPGAALASSAHRLIMTEIFGIGNPYPHYTDLLCGVSYPITLTYLTIWHYLLSKNGVSTVSLAWALCDANQGISQCMGLSFVYFLLYFTRATFSSGLYLFITRHWGQ